MPAPTQAEKAAALEEELRALGVKAKGFKSDAGSFNAADELVTAVINGRIEFASVVYEPVSPIPSLGSKPRARVTRAIFTSPISRVVNLRSSWR